MKDGKFKELAYALKEQYDKYENKVFFVRFYTSLSQTSIGHIGDFHGFVKHMPVDMIHIHMCDSGDYIDVYEWELEDFEVCDNYIKILHNGKISFVWYYKVPKRIDSNRPLWAVQLTNNGELQLRCFTVFYTFLNGVSIVDEYGSLSFSSFDANKLFVPMTVKSNGTLLFFDNSRYIEHMKERLLTFSLMETKEEIKKKESFVKKLEEKLKEIKNGKI